MKLVRLLKPLLAFILFIAVPTARSVEPKNTLSSTIQFPVSNWHTECVDCPKAFSDMTDRSLRLDSEGQPHIAYGGRHLYYAWRDGTQWHYETVDQASRIGWYASLALDGSDRPHISYCDSVYVCHDLKYAWHDGIDWQVETVDNVGRVGGHTSLALDSLGRPHISYYDLENDSLKYAQHDGMGWQIETIDGPGVGYYISLALDNSGQPHISYHDHSPGSLKYAWRDETGWHVETVDSDTHGHTSLALDSLGQPHISYYWTYYGDFYEDSGIKYARRDETGWHFEMVDNWGSGQVSLTLDSSDRPHIGYRRTSYHVGDINQEEIALMYAWRDGTSWHTEIVDGGEGLGYSTSLALDEAGRPHISANRGGSGELEYVWYDGTIWHVETVDSAGWVGDFNSLALTCPPTEAIQGYGTSQSHISHHDWYNGDLKHTWYDGTSWHSETVDDKGDVGKYNSLALDGAGRPHISYYDDTNDDLKYARHDGTSWRIETVDNEGDVGSHTSLALDGSNHPHIIYYERGDADFKYAWHDGAVWYIETLTGMHGNGHSSLALDRAGRPHISLYGYEDTPLNAHLIYAWRDEAGWQIEMVDDQNGHNSSLVLDSLDRPHISYNNVSSRNLMYASLAPPATPSQCPCGRAGGHDGTSWHIEMVDDRGNAGDSLSLALDGADQPHIAYRRHEPDSGFKYASLAPPATPSQCLCGRAGGHDGTNWRIETIDTGWAGFVSLALTCPGAARQGGGADRPHISLSNWGQLKYTQLMPLPSLEKQAIPSDGLRNDDALAYTLTLSGPGLSVRLWDPLPPSIRYVSGSITSAIAPPAVYSPSARVISWQGTLPTDTVQVIRFQVQVGAGTGSLSLALPIVNTAWLTDTYSGFDVSARVIVNSLRVYLPVMIRND